MTCFFFFWADTTWPLANLHIMTLGHRLPIHMLTIDIGNLDYLGSPDSPGLVEMNLSHIITDFFFGFHFPDIVQPLDNSFKATDKSQFIFCKYHGSIINSSLDIIVFQFSCML